jgi:hypothetical protein
VKKIVLVIFLSILSVGLLFNLSSGQTNCDPADSNGTDCCDTAKAPGFNYSYDLGACDTLHVVPWPYTDTCVTYKSYTCDENGDVIDSTIVDTCINNPGQNFPCFMYVNLLVTHDSNSFFWGDFPPSGKWTRDSIYAMVIPLGWTRTNPAKYCSLSTYWNENTVDRCEEGYPRRMWRNFPPLGSDSTNLMDKLKWATMIVGLSSDIDTVITPDTVYITPPHAFLNLISNLKRQWRQEHDTLLATLTFSIEDTMHVCIDSTLCPPSNNLLFIRPDSKGYIPRTNLPLCIWGGPPILVTSPKGGAGAGWLHGTTHDITWVSGNFTGPNVKLEFSADGGTNWTPIIASTPNDGVHSWLVPNTLSDSCKIKVSDALDGDPYDVSDNLFSTKFVGVEDLYQLPDVPKEFALSQNYPNPFNPTTTIEFAITEPGEVNIDIFNTLGQRVETLVNKRLNPGTYRVIWNAPPYLSSGLYFYRIKTGEFTETKKMVRVK